MPVWLVVVDELALDSVTVTVTVVVDCDRVFDLLVCVDFVFVVFGGWIVTVLDGEVVVQTEGRLVLPQAPVSGGPVDAEPVVMVSVPVSVSVPPVSVLVVVGEELHDEEWRMWQSDCPMPVFDVIVVDAVVPGPEAAARAASPGPGACEPPAARTLTGTAATTTRGIQERALARIRAGRTCGCTALPQGRDVVPPPRPCQGSVHMFAFPPPSLSGRSGAVSRWPDAEDRCGATA